MHASLERHCGWSPLAAIALLAVVTLGASPAAAWQGGKSVPTFRYHAAFTLVDEGDYAKALEQFQHEGRHAIKTVQSRWIDSICYHTMCGECYYHMGKLPKALEQYTSAVQLFIAFQDWMLRVNFPPTVRPAGAGKYRMPEWGRPQRQVTLGDFPSTILMSQGRINNNDVVQRGGVVQQAILFPVEVQEIVRCTCLAIRRRAQLLGPVSQHDPLTGELIAALSRRPGPPNHWSECWIDLELGLALAAGGKEGQALPYLQRSVLAAGQYDHPLTATALLELGRLALASGDYDNASKMLLESTFAAFQYGDSTVLEEAFRLGAAAHVMAGRPGLYPPLAPAAAWAKKERLRNLQATLMLMAAENYIGLNEPAKASALLADLASVIGKRDMAAGWIGARGSFLSATVAYQQKRPSDGDALLARAMAFMQGGGSFWLFQLSVADGMVTSGTASERVGMDLYETLLRDPAPSDWTADPLEALAVLSTPHPSPLEHWFEVALARKEHEKALEIADRARRHRFFSSLAMGGRLQTLRWLLESPPGLMIDSEAKLHRQDLLMKYPAFAQWSDRLAALLQQLRAVPPADNTPEALRQQGELLRQITEVNQQQEAILREMGVRRDPAKMAFPPLVPTDAIQDSLPDGHAMLAFFSTSRHLYGFLLNNKQYAYWRIGSPDLLYRQIVAYLRNLGLYEQNREISVKELAADAWKQQSADLLETILAGSEADFSTDFEELIVVPDGVLWYVPFEAMHVKVDGNLEPLISRVRVRYVPTAGLAVPYGPGRRPSARTGVVAGKLFPQDDEQIARDAYRAIAGILPGSFQITSPLPGPSGYYKTILDRLVVLDDIAAPEQGPYSWPPIPADRGKPGNTLGDWLALPWQGPDEVVFPGFHTAAESSLKGVSPALAGHEVFLTVCGLLASGPRTALLSRWRTGGASSYDLVREFVQELPHTSPADAWQRAVFLTAESEIDAAAEPRVKESMGDAPLRGDHPFFWAGYLLVDAGSVQATVDTAPAPAEPPVLKIKPAAAADGPAPGAPAGANL